MSVRPWCIKSMTYRQKAGVALMWLVVLLAVMFGGVCKKKNQGPSQKARWSGIPDVHACSWNGDFGRCISEDKRYECIREHTESTDGCKPAPEGDVVCKETHVPGFDLGLDIGLKK